MKPLTEKLNDQAEGLGRVVAPTQNFENIQRMNNK